MSQQDTYSLCSVLQAIEIQKYCAVNTVCAIVRLVSFSVSLLEFG